MYYYYKLNKMGSGLYRIDCKPVIVIEFHSWLTKIEAYGINILCTTSQQAPYLWRRSNSTIIHPSESVPSLESPSPSSSSPSSLSLSMAPSLSDVRRLVHRFLFAVETCGLPTRLIVYQVHTAQRFLEMSSQPHPRRTSGKNDRGGTRG